jgi:hypothetical protein
MEQMYRAHPLHHSMWRPLTLLQLLRPQTIPGGVVPGTVPVALSAPVLFAGQVAQVDVRGTAKFAALLAAELAHLVVEPRAGLKAAQLLEDVPARQLLTTPLARCAVTLDAHDEGADRRPKDGKRVLGAGATPREI